MSTNLYINHCDYYIPENKVILKELNYLFEENIPIYASFGQLLDFTKEKIPEYSSFEHFLEFAKYGFGLDSVRVEDKITPTEALRKLIKRNVDSGNIRPKEINYILIAPFFNSSLKDFGHAIQYEFGMTNAAVLRIGDNYSVNTDLAINIASKLIVNAEHEDQNILILGGDFFGNNFKRRIISNYGIAADNASLLMVSNKNNGARFVFKNQEVIVNGQLNGDNEKVDNTFLHFRSFSECLKNCMIHNKLTPDEIKKIIVPNANLYLIEQALAVNKIGPEKIFRKNWGTYGHLGVTDLLLNLSDFGKETGNVGDAIISLNMGISGTHVANLFERITQ